MSQFDKHYNRNSLPGWIYFNYYWATDRNAPSNTDTCTIRKIILFLWFWRGGGRLIKPWMVTLFLIFLIAIPFHTTVSAWIGFIAISLLVLFICSIAISAILFSLIKLAHWIKDSRASDSFAAAGDVVLDKIDLAFGKNTLPNRIWRTYWKTKLFHRLPIWTITTWPTYLFLHYPAYLFSHNYLFSVLVLIDLLILCFTPVVLSITYEEEIADSRFAEWFNNSLDIITDSWDSLVDRVCKPAIWDN